MRIGILSDIHGNLPALESVLKKIDELGLDRLHCLGDIVGYGSFPNECVELIRSRCSIVVKGNHDSGLTGETSIDDFNNLGQQAIRWTRKQILPEHFEYLKTLPMTAIEGQVTYVHSSPAEPEQWTYIFSIRSAEEAFFAFSTDLCFIGHTHVPVIIGEDMSINSYVPPRDKSGNLQRRFLINVGSIGQPRDGNPEAAFGILDTETLEYELLRVPYDIEKAATAITKAGLPAALAKRLYQGV